MVFGRDGVLKPPDIGGVVNPGEPGSASGVERPVTVEGNIGPITDAIGYGTDDLGFVHDCFRTNMSVSTIAIVAAGDIEIEL